MPFRNKLAALAVSLAAAAPLGAAAEEADIDEGLSLLGRGAQLLVEGLLAELGPELARLRDNLEGLGGYYPPEVLPNGDILIRRRPPAEVAPVPDAGTGEVDL